MPMRTATPTPPPPYPSLCLPPCPPPPLAFATNPAHRESTTRPAPRRRRRPHPTSSTGLAATHDHPAKAAGHGDSPTTNPKIRTLRLLTSAAACARRRPVVGRTAHNPLTNHHGSLRPEPVGDGVLVSDFVTFLFFSLLSSICEVEMINSQ